MCAEGRTVVIAGLGRLIDDEASVAQGSAGYEDLAEACLLFDSPGAGDGCKKRVEPAALGEKRVMEVRPRPPLWDVAS